MEKLMIQQTSLQDALLKCKKYNEIITSDKLGERENIHCHNDAFYYEDGCLIGNNIQAACDLLNSMEWTNAAKWYVIGRFNEVEATELAMIHSHERAYFEREYMKLTEIL